MQMPNFLTKGIAEKIANQFELPVYVYDEKSLIDTAGKFLDFPNAYGLTVRYAMKANPNQNILKIIVKKGIQIDASSEFEVYRAINAGIKVENIQLTAQELPRDLEKIVNLGIIYNACSLHQLESFGKLFPGKSLSIRINPGLGSGGTARTNVGGPASSFGIWHDYIPQALEIARKYDLKITRLHTHIGSGSDPDVWTKVAKMSLDTVKNFPDVEILNLGGGFKIARMDYEKTTDLQKIGTLVKGLFKDFANQTGRKLHLEIEPGTYLVANACSVLAKVQDVVDTGSDGYNFIKINSGMTDVTRPIMYGSQHPLFVLNNNNEFQEYIVAGHCCESGDIWTPANGDPEGLLPRSLNKAKIGDLFVIDGAGAYCAGMSTKNYNSFPESGEVLIKTNGEIVEIRKRQSVEQIWQNEIRSDI